MDPWYVLVEIAVLIGVALVLGLLFERLGLSSLSGYLLAGAVLGPGAMNIVQGGEMIDVAAELGVSLLLFTIGLEFSWRRLSSLGSMALLGGTAQILITAAAVTGIGLLLGASLPLAVGVGFIIAPSSTAVALRVLRESDALDSPFGRNALGVLLLQDAALVPLVLVVTALGAGGGLLSIAAGFGTSLLITLGLFFGFWLVIRFIMPLALDAMSGAGNRDLFILLAVVIFLFAVWIAHAFKVSPALGAFVAGVLLAESPYAAQLRADMSGLRAIFVALFFVSVGMLTNVMGMLESWSTILLLLLAVTFGKLLVVLLIMGLFRQPFRHSLATGLSLAMVGEFSFLLADVALGTGLLDEQTFQLLISTTILSLFISPFMVSTAGAVGRRVEHWFRKIGLVRSALKRVEPQEPVSGHVLVIGLGPAGQKAIDVLTGECIDVIALDLNPKLVRKAKTNNIAAHVGDATQAEVLDHAHALSASAIVVTIPDRSAAESIIRHTRMFCPNVPIIARSRWNRFNQDIINAGAEDTIDEEELVGDAIGHRVLARIY